MLKHCILRQKTTGKHRASFGYLPVGAYTVLSLPKIGSRGSWTGQSSDFETSETLLNSDHNAVQVRLMISLLIPQTLHVLYTVYCLASAMPFFSIMLYSGLPFRNLDQVNPNVYYVSLLW